MSTLDYKPYVDPANVPRLDKAMCRMSLFEYPPFIEGLLGMWGPLSRQPFRGVTTDGTPRAGLFTLEDQGAPVQEAVNATKAWLASLDPAIRSSVSFPVDSDAWRHWQNTPLVLRDPQVELEALNKTQRFLALEIVRVSLSQNGYRRTQEVIANNVFLGELNQLTEIMNAWSFTMSVFGEPSMTEPWGWQLFGHHLALNCLFIGGQMVLSPVFMGLEPDVGLEGRRRMFEPHEEAALGLMRSLSETERARAVLYDSMLTADQPPGRFHPDDGRVIAAAFQDNRVSPYEGVRLGALGAEQRRRVLELAELFIENLPQGPAAARLKDVEKHLDETHFAWIGKANDVDPFYFRIHGPVALIEFDHHSGVFLANKEPERFHVHTVLRTPNGNDYGMDLLRQHYAAGGHDRDAGSPATSGAAHGEDHAHDHDHDHDHDHGAHSHDGGATYHRHD